MVVQWRYSATIFRAIAVGRYSRHQSTPLLDRLLGDRPIILAYSSRHKWLFLLAVYQRRLRQAIVLSDSLSRYS